MQMKAHIHKVHNVLPVKDGNVLEKRRVAKPMTTRQLKNVNNSLFHACSTFYLASDGPRHWLPSEAEHDSMF